MGADSTQYGIVKFSDSALVEDGCVRVVFCFFSLPPGLRPRAYNVRFDVKLQVKPQEKRRVSARPGAKTEKMMWRRHDVSFLLGIFILRKNLQELVGFVQSREGSSSRVGGNNGSIC